MAPFEVLRAFPFEILRGGGQTRKILDASTDLIFVTDPSAHIFFFHNHPSYNTFFFGLSPFILFFPPPTEDVKWTSP